MSGRIKAARAGYSGDPARMRRAMPGTGYAGDPGLFGFLGKVAKGALGTVAGVATGQNPLAALRGGFGRAFSGKTGMPAMSSKAQYYQARILSGAAGPAETKRAIRQFPSLQSLGMGMGGQVEQYQGVRGQFNGQPGGGRGTVMMAGEGGACPSGYKPNKTGYWVTSPMGTPSYVSPGERCVKIRKRNPLNPRAWDRAYSRLKSSKRWQKKIGAVSFRTTC